jgi:hypothetical protein
MNDANGVSTSSQPEASRRKAKLSDVGASPNNEAAMLCMRKEGGTIWRSGLKLKGAAGDAPQDVSPHV